MNERIEDVMLMSIGALWPLRWPLYQERNRFGRCVDLYSCGEVAWIDDRELMSHEAGEAWFSAMCRLGLKVVGARMAMRANVLRDEVMLGHDQRELPACLLRSRG